MLFTPMRLQALGLSVLATCLLPLPARADVLFKGDMETGTLKQWSYLLKEEGLSVVTDTVAEGKYAGKVTISKNEVWDNGLNRVEVQHKPDNAYLTEGKDIYYGFSFYLPKTLTTDNHQILYWETTETYQQVMQLAVEGERMRFATQKPSWKVHWEADGKATAGKWHRVVIHVKWSASADTGLTDLWFDGDQVVTAGKAQTFLGTPAFVQHGILRDTIDTVETLYFDDARSGTALADVLTPAGMSGGAGAGGMPSGGTSGGGAAGASGMPNGGTLSGGSSTGGSAMAGASAGGQQNGTSGAPSNTGSAGAPSGAGGVAGSASGGASASAGTAPAGATANDDSGCSFAPSTSSGASALAALLGLGALRRRRR
jgi:MYXO-CTERM domain-containing protein